MHDTLEYFSTNPIHRRFHHHQLTFGLIYAFTENFVLPLCHDEVVHGKGSLLEQDAGRPLAAAGQPAGAVRVDVGPPRQAAAVHGRRDRPGPGVVRRPQPRLAPARAPEPRRASHELRPRRSTACTRSSPALWERRLRPRRASAGSTPTTPTRACYSFLRCSAGRRRPAGGLRRQPHAGAPRTATGSALPAGRPVAGACSTPTPPTFGGSGVGNRRSPWPTSYAVARPRPVGRR